MRLNTGIEHLDLTLKRLRSNSGEEFECEHLLLATGAQARKLDGRGNDVDNVFYLRSLKDSGTIRSRSAGAKAAVIIGGGFIGMEVASVLAQKNIQTTLVIREDRVWSRVFTPVMSAFFEQYYTAPSRTGIYAAGDSQIILIPSSENGGGLSIGTMLFLKVSIGRGWF